jgi:hypothetical protein
MAAVSTVALFAIASLAIDLGLAYTARSEAQRVADASALAGASAFLDFGISRVEKQAHIRAIDYATRNFVRNHPVDSSQVTVQILTDSLRIRVWVQSPSLQTWFARFLGISSLQVNAMAAAEVAMAGVTARCVLPMTVPDIWDDFDDDNNPENELPDPLEDWDFDTEDGDEYERFDGKPCNEPTCEANGTGYGSNHRNASGDGVEADYGRRLWIKNAPPGLEDENLQGMIAPGNFLFWQMPDPEDVCRTAGGADQIADNIRRCNNCPIALFVDYDAQTGGIASIANDIRDLVNQDPNAVWNETENELVSDHGENSPRVRVIPIWDPNIELTGTSQPIHFNNFAKVFVEGMSRDRGIQAISARFMGLVQGDPGGGGTGTLVKYLRLVE